METHFFNQENCIIVQKTPKLCLSLSSDSEYLAISTPSFNPKIYKTSNFQPIKLLTAHQDLITTLHFHGQRALLASGSLDKTILVHDLQTYQAVCLKGHSSTVNSVNFMDFLLASGSNDNSIIIWELKNFSIYKQLFNHNNIVQQVTFSPDGRYLSSLAFNDCIYIYDTKTFQIQKKIEQKSFDHMPLNYSPDGTILAFGSQGAIKLWNLDILEEIEQKQNNNQIQFSRVEFFPKLNYLLGIQKIAGFSNLYVWEHDNLHLLDYSRNIEGYIRETCFSMNGQRWAAVIDEFKIIICDSNQLHKTLNQQQLCLESPNDQENINLQEQTDRNQEKFDLIMSKYRNSSYKSSNDSQKSFEKQQLFEQNLQNQSDNQFNHQYQDLRINHNKNLQEKKIRKSENMTINHINQEQQQNDNFQSENINQIYNQNQIQKKNSEKYQNIENVENIQNLNEDIQNILNQFSSVIDDFFEKQLIQQKQFIQVHLQKQKQQNEFLVFQNNLHQRITQLKKIITFQSK